MMVPPDAVGIVHRQAYQFYAEIPFQLGRGAPPKPDYTIRDYVQSIADRNTIVQYRYAWWTLPYATAAIWGGGAALLIGGVWPILLNLMVGAGFGRAKQAEPDYDLDRFKAGQEPVSSSPSRHTGAGNQQQVQEYADSLERDLASTATATQTAGSPPAEASQAVRKLDAGPLETAATTAQPEDEKEFAGEYYPVARPHGHDAPQKP
jgi:hypothetical protein